MLVISVATKNLAFNEMDTCDGELVNRVSRLGKYEIVGGVPRLACGWMDGCEYYI